MPVWLAIIIGVAGALFGAVGTVATFRRGDLGGHRLRHILEISDRGRSRLEREAGRKGVVTLCYAVSQTLDGHIILHVPHSILNPGRLPIKNVSVLVTYSGEVGLEDDFFRKIWATFGDGDPEYFKSRKGEITGHGTQVMFSAPVLRGGEAVHFADFFVLPPIPAKRGRQGTSASASPFEARMKANPLVRECFELTITIFSEMARARTRKCNIVVLNDPGHLEPQRALEILSESFWAGGRPEPGLYIKSPWSANPLAWEFADFIHPALEARALVNGQVFHLEAPAKSKVARGIYSAPAVDYRDMPGDLSPTQRENYLGISKVFMSHGGRKIVGRVRSILGRFNAIDQKARGAVSGLARRILRRSDRSD